MGSCASFVVGDNPLASRRLDARHRRRRYAQRDRLADPAAGPVRRPGFRPGVAWPPSRVAAVTRVGCRARPRRPPASVRAWRSGLGASVYYLGVSRSQRSGRLLSRGLSGHSHHCGGQCPEGFLHDRGPLMPVFRHQRAGTANPPGPGTVPAPPPPPHGPGMPAIQPPRKPARPQPAWPKTYTRSYKPTVRTRNAKRAKKAGPGRACVLSLMSRPTANYPTGAVTTRDRPGRHLDPADITKPAQEPDNVMVYRYVKT